MSEEINIEVKPEDIRDQGIRRIQYFIERAKKEPNSFNIEGEFYAMMKVAKSTYNRLRILNNEGN